jgi:hypothetical protein
VLPPNAGPAKLWESNVPVKKRLLKGFFQIKPIRREHFYANGCDAQLSASIA